MSFEGFILTRQWRDEPDGVVLELWLSTESGAVRVTVPRQESVGFIAAADMTKVNAILPMGQDIRAKELSLRSFSGEAVFGLYFRSQRAMLNAGQTLAEKGIHLLEGDVRPAERFLMERFIQGAVTVDADFPRQGHGQRHGEVEVATLRPGHYRPSLKRVSLDIETSFDGRHLLSIGLYGEGINQVMMVAPDNVLQHKSGNNRLHATSETVIHWYPSEPELLTAFLQWLREEDPDVLIGWNVVNFDFRFLQKKYDQHRIPFAIGRGDQRVIWRQASGQSQHYFLTIPGRVVLDGIDTLKAATYSFESFALEFVSRQLLERGKLIHDVDNRAQEILRLYRENPAALADYNIEDCRLVWDIFAATDLMHFALERSRLTGLPLDKTGGSVAAFENLYLPRLHRQGYVAPNVGMMRSDIQAPGGYVMDSVPGLYEHVLVLDFKSLYPSIIRTFCIDPLSLVHSLQQVAPDTMPAPEMQGKAAEPAETADTEWIPGFNGAVFSKTRHLLPDIIDQLWQARDQAKQQGDQPLSQAIKIIMNSFYGVLGTPLCRFFDPRLSSSITLRGHDILQQTRRLIEAEGHQVIYGDTDSVFVWLAGNYDAEAADRRGRELANYLTCWWQRALKTRFGITSYLELEYETHYRRFHMPKMRGSDAGSKKRYAGLVGTGQREKLVFKGLENVRTDWTHLAREVQYQVYWKVFHHQKVDDYLKETVTRLKAGELDDQLFYRKRLRRALHEYERNVPPHVQAARKADAWRQSCGMPQQYQNGGWIEYLITVNGPEPREHLESALDYEHYLERQLAPAVDGVLAETGTSLAEILDQQLPLF
ncbi:MAG: DNA polymerase II [Ketobacteraceae bacterium]|nr:DNA polymerase II [Ketobacteraceae bacterium]